MGSHCLGKGKKGAGSLPRRAETRGARICAPWPEPSPRTSPSPDPRMSLGTRQPDFSMAWRLRGRLVPGDENANPISALARPRVPPQRGPGIWGHPRAPSPMEGCAARHQSRRGQPAPRQPSADTANSHLTTGSGTCHHTRPEKRRRLSPWLHRMRDAGRPLLRIRGHRARSSLVCCGRVPSVDGWTGRTAPH